MAENDKLIKERGLFTKEIIKMENLMEVITKPVSSDVKALENSTIENNIETFKTLQAQANVNFQLMVQYKKEVDQTRVKNEEILNLFEALKKSLRLQKVQALEKKNLEL